MFRFSPDGFTDAERSLIRSASTYLIPKDYVDVVEWAKKNIKLVDKASAYSGPWDDAICPYVREPLRAMVDPDCEEVWLCWASQVFKTTLLLAAACYLIKNDPGPMMWVMNNEQKCRSFNRKRFEPTINASPDLRALKPSNPKEFSLLSKAFSTCDLTFTGANSAGNLASDPIRYAIGDEVDKYAEMIRSEAGSVELLKERTKSFPNFKRIFASTPSLSWKQTQQGLIHGTNERYWVPSPRTGEFFLLCFALLKWDQAARHKSGVWDLQMVEETAYIECPFSGEPIWDLEKAEMLEKGEWRPKSQEDRDRDQDPPLTPRQRSFHLNAFYSQHANCSWGKIAVEHLKAGQDPSKRKTFTNSWLAETDDAEIEKVNEEEVKDRREVYPSDEMLPEKVLVLTCGVDVQESPARLEYEIMGWGLGDEIWGIHYGVIPGDSRDQDTWDRLDKELLRSWDHPSGVSLGVASTCVDSGYDPKSVYNFVETRQVRRVYAVKGYRGGPGTPIYSRPKKSEVKQVLLYMVSRHSANDFIFSRLKLKEPGSGYMHFPIGMDDMPVRGYDEEFFKQLTSSEHMEFKYLRGERVGYYHKTGANEALACRRYGVAAFLMLNADLPLIAQQMELRLEESKKGEGAEEKKADMLERRSRRRKGASRRRSGGGFVTSY